MFGFTFKVILFYLFFIFLSFQSYGCTFNCGSLEGSLSVLPQEDPGGPAVKYGDSYFTTEMPETARPNDATISLYEDGRRGYFQQLKIRGNMYSIPPKGNAEPFKITKNLKSETLEAQLSKGYILSYLYMMT